jgi:hypothetical protein
VITAVYWSAYGRFWAWTPLRRAQVEQVPGDACQPIEQSVVGITHTNSNLKNTQSMSLFFAFGRQKSIDGTVVAANNSTDSIYYHSGYTLPLPLPRPTSNFLLARRVAGSNDQQNLTPL